MPKNINKFLLFVFVMSFIMLACGIGGGEEQANDALATASAVVEDASQQIDEESTKAAELVEGAGEQLEEAAQAAEATASAIAVELQEDTNNTTDETGDETGDETTNNNEMPTDEGEFEDATIELNSINESLESLSSYQANLQIEFAGTDANDEDANGTVDMLLEYTQSPARFHMSMTAEGSIAAEFGDGGNVNIDMYDVDGTFYLQNPEDGSWISFPSDGNDGFGGGFFSPDDIVELPKTARRSLIPEEVNGISAWKYTFNEDDITDEDMQLDSASGEVWIAQEGGYPVKYNLEATGSDLNATGNDLIQSGTFKVTYDLLAVNSDFNIEVPEEALNAGGLEDLFDGMGEVDASEVDLPMTDDAEVDFAMEGLVNYYTNMSVEEIAAFYNETLSAEGWTSNPDKQFISEENALLTYTKDGEELLIGIGIEDDGRALVNLISSSE